MGRATEYINLFIKKVLLSLWYARYKVYARTEQSLKGCVLATLGLVSILLAEGLSPDVTLFSFPRLEYVRLRIVRRDATDHLWTLQSAYIEGAISCYIMQVARTIGSELLSKGVKAVPSKDAEKKWFI